MRDQSGTGGLTFQNWVVWVIILPGGFVPTCWGIWGKADCTRWPAATKIRKLNTLKNILVKYGDTDCKMELYYFEKDFELLGKSYIL